MTKTKYLQESVAISVPEFMDIQTISPKIAKTDLKIMYVGESRNGTVFDKSTIVRMAATLKGSPIVGFFKEEKEDFRDHGTSITFDGDGITEKCQTTPYGFVDINSDIWFQRFQEVGLDGQTVEREYLMTKGYLWVEQFPEAQIAVEGKSISMELDPDAMIGYWTNPANDGPEFFIVNDAVFSKLCILGDDVEPCYEGAKIEGEVAQANYSFDTQAHNFALTLYSMMKDLKEVLETETGTENKEGEIMAKDKVEQMSEEILDNTDQGTAEENKDTMNSYSEEDNKAEAEKEAKAKEEEEEKTKSAKAEEDKKAEAEKEAKAKEEEEEKTKSAKAEKKEEESDKKDKEENKYSLLESQYAELKDKYNELEVNYKKLEEFKAAAEEKEKDALIDSFYMLSDEDKKDVVSNKNNYTLDDIEGKLAIVCVRKKVNFSEDTTPNVTYSFNGSESKEEIPSWLEAVENTKNKK